jgi:hypothetical protein
MRISNLWYDSEKFALHKAYSLSPYIIIVLQTKKKQPQYQILKTKKNIYTHKLAYYIATERIMLFINIH